MKVYYMNAMDNENCLLCAFTIFHSFYLTEIIQYHESIMSFIISVLNKKIQDYIISLFSLHTSKSYFY